MKDSFKCRQVSNDRKLFNYYVVSEHISGRGRRVQDFDSGRTSIIRNWLVGLCVAIGITGISGNVSLVRAQTSTTAIQASPAIASSTVALNRIALTILPKPAAASARAALAQADEDFYRKRLRELGFEVRTIAPANRLDLDRTLRDAALGIPRRGQSRSAAARQCLRIRG